MNELDQANPRAIQPPVMKKMNQLSLLTLIMEHGPISRSDLARLSRLSKPTVSAQVEGLIRNRLVSETGQESQASEGAKSLLIWSSTRGLVTWP